MRIAVNPFLASAAVAVVVVVAVAMLSQRRAEPQVVDTTGPSGRTTLALVVVLLTVLVPFSIAIAALWGPSVGIAAYVALFAGGSIALAVSRRSRQ